VNYFLDTEFIEDGPERPIELLSVGIVSDDGRSFYAENQSADLGRANDWVRANVLPHMRGPKMSRADIARAVVEFMPPASKPKVWGYFADYDWVLFAQLFGRMIDLPKGYPFYCRDLKQWADALGIKRDRFPDQKGQEHNALADAEWNRSLFRFLSAAQGREPEPDDA